MCLVVQEATQKAMEEAIDEYLASGRNELTLLIIGGLALPPAERRLYECIGAADT